jgi:hypothetical protein
MRRSIWVESAATTVAVETPSAANAGRNLNKFVDIMVGNLYTDAVCNSLQPSSRRADQVPGDARMVSVLRDGGYLPAALFSESQVWVDLG